MKKVKLTSEIIKNHISDESFFKREYFQDANDTSLQSGIHGINFNAVQSINLPNGVTYGSMIVFNGDGLSDTGNPIFQILISGNGFIFIRSKWHVQNFSEWRPL